DSDGKSPQLEGGNSSRLGGGDLSRSGIANPKLWLGALLLWLALSITMDPTLWKSHRTIRFESLTAFCFALTWVSWLAVPWRWRGLAMGLGAGLAFLSHPAGALASGVTGFLFLTDPKPLATRLRQLGLAALTVVLCILPWALYLLGDREADFVNFLGQNAPHLDGRDHGLLEQMALERQRYLAYFPLPYLAFPLLATVVTLLAGLRFRVSRVVLVPALTLILGLSLLPNKSELYLTLLMPFVYLMAATLAQRYPRRWVAALGGLWLAFYVAADFTLLKRHRSCDLNAWSAAVVDPIADGDSVAGSYLTWFALKDHEYVEYTRQRAGDVYDRRPTFVIWGGSITVQENFKRLREEMEPLLAQYGEQVAATDSSSCYGKLTLFRPHWDAIPADFAESLERYGDQE
ncbi:MAG: hypothetical protein HKN21_08870, partial [Candidatus Eisenbacteria bacterium]|nr:hypothetical protein [Candidatus Eisenbacteria bacterium]